MKRLLLLPVLMFGLSFACDQPYEEVAGIKIGCPFDGSLEAKDSGDSDGRIATYKDDLQDGFFESVDIRTLDGNVESVSFSKMYRDAGALKKDREILFAALSNKWGNAELISEDEMLIVSTIREPKSDIIDLVMGAQMLMGPAGFLSVDYVSKKMNAYSEEMKEQEAARKNQQLEGF